MLEYLAEAPAQEARTIVLKPAPVSGSAKAVVSSIGAGNYATSVLIPAFRSAGARLRMVASSGGVSAWHAGRRFGIEEVTTDVDRVLADPETTAVVLATRHNTHARLVVAALRAGKHVFVEKPLCLTLEEVTEIEGVARTAGRHLMVGFNRRFAPHVDRMRSLLAGVPGPRAFVVTVNAGAVPRDHWVQDLDVGGGRILGEACHFIDLVRHLARAPFTRWARFDLDARAGDTASLELVFADGSIGTIHYFANGSRRFPKERLEVFAGGRVLQLDNFRRLHGYGWRRFSGVTLWRQDKGQRACVDAFLQAVEHGGPPPIPIEELLEVARVTLEVAGAARK